MDVQGLNCKINFHKRLSTRVSNMTLLNNETLSRSRGRVGKEMQKQEIWGFVRAKSSAVAPCSYFGGCLRPQCLGLISWTERPVGIMVFISTMCREWSFKSVKLPLNCGSSFEDGDTVKCPNLCSGHWVRQSRYSKPKASTIPRIVF